MSNGTIVLINLSRVRTFCSSGELLIMSVMKDGNNSVTCWTPAENVPSEVVDPAGWPCFLAWSTHCRVTESTTYRTPSLYGPGAFLK